MAAVPEGLVAKTDKFGRTDYFDEAGRSVVSWKLIDDWENVPYANKWTLDLASLPAGIVWRLENNEPTLKGARWCCVLTGPREGVEAVD